MKNLNSKTVLITGVSRGLGYCLLDSFHSRGYTVIGVVRKTEDLDRLLIEYPKRFFGIIADLASNESVEIIKSRLAKIGLPIDLIINNAGIASKTLDFFDIDLDEFSEVFNVNCMGSLRVLMASYSYLLKSDNPEVISISSRLGSLANQNKGVYKHIESSFAYGTSKVAQNMISVRFRNQFKDKVKVYMIHPGSLSTDMANLDTEKTAEISAKEIIDAYESGSLEEGDGVNEIGKPVIPW